MRNRHLAAIPLAALLLTACASATDAAPLTTPTPEPTATAIPTPAAGDFAWLNRHDSSFNSGDAYYEMVYRNHGGLLLKTDYTTAAQTVVCGVPGCTHDSADCPAWFPGRYRYYCPFTADGAVYVLNATPAGSNLWVYQDTYTNVLPARGSRAEDWLWLYGTDGAVGGNRCYLLNAATRELVPITQRMKNYAYDIPPSLLAQTADGRWLLWTESNDENAHLAYGLIAPNDFAAGSTDYTPVEMWAG